MNIVNRVNPKSSDHKEKFFSFSFFWYLYEIKGIHWTYCGNPFIIHVLYPLSLHSVNYNLNKIVKENK